MRHYSPIWEAIKKNKQASIVAPVSKHKLIIKAVIKEKNEDGGYKLLLSEKCKRARLIISFDANNRELILFSIVISLIDKYIGLKYL